MNLPMLKQSWQNCGDEVMFVRGRISPAGSCLSCTPFHAPSSRLEEPEKDHSVDLLLPDC